MPTEIDKDLGTLRARADLVEWQFPSTIPVLGRLVAMVRRTVHSIAGRWALRALATQQSQFNHELLNTLDRLSYRIEHLERMVVDLDRAALTIRREMVEAAIGQRREQTVLAERLAVVEARQGLVEALQGRLEALERWVEGLGAVVASQRSQLPNRERSSSGAVSSDSQPAVTPDQRPPDVVTTDGLVDYFLFEMRYRGRPDEIKRRQEPYLQYFEGKQGEVLDLGCGRGEFLKLLTTRGIPARGVDLDPDMVDYCRQNGLSVEQGDLIDYLARVADNSLGGIFLGQVVEHLPSVVLGRLVTLAYRKLHPDAYLVAETINPMCVLAMTTHYLMDPSHVRPVHPELLRFVLQCAGFRDVEVIFSSPVPDGARLKRFPATDTLTATELQWLPLLNENVDRLNELLYGYQDYAIVARKFVWPERLSPPATRRVVSMES